MTKKQRGQQVTPATSWSKGRTMTTLLPPVLRCLSLKCFSYSKHRSCSSRLHVPQLCFQRVHEKPQDQPPITRCCLEAAAAELHAPPSPLPPNDGGGDDYECRSGVESATVWTGKDETTKSGLLQPRQVRHRQTARRLLRWHSCGEWVARCSRLGMTCLLCRGI